MKTNKSYVVLLVSTAFFLLASAAGAAVDKVRCIPWQGDTSKYHTAISGQIVGLRAVVTTTDTSTVWYKWIYGDGTESFVSQLSGSTQYDVEVFYTYGGAVGTPFTARLMVDSVDNTMANAVSDNFLVILAENNLDAKVNIAIDRGLWYLYTHQLKNAYVQSKVGEPVAAWSSYNSYHPSASAVAIQAFEINNHKETGNFDEDPYAEVVNAGLNWLLNGRYGATDVLNAIALNPAYSPHGDPDSNGNGVGVQVNYSGYAPYQGGMIMDAIISSGTPDADSGRDFDGDGTSDTYRQIVQDMVDAYAWGQGDANHAAYTGWAYSWNSNTTDNSTNQWAAIGLIPAEDNFGATIPAFVKSRMDQSLTYTYNVTQRYFGYRNSTGLVGSTASVTRPSGMVQMFLAVPDYKTDQRWTGPESWYAENFTLAFSAGERSYYGWLSFVKAMILSQTETLSNGLNWYRGSSSVTGLAARLIEEQEGDGSWPQGSQRSHPGYYGETFVTGWAIQMLKPALFEAAPIACYDASPNPTYAGRDIFFDPTCSDHSDAAKDINDIVLFEWDWDNDGLYDTNSIGPDEQITQFACDVLPCTYPVVLKVTDDEGITATFSLDIKITNPPHPPESDAGGPYLVSTCAEDSLTLDGSNSFEPNEGEHEAGCASCPDDTITAWDWDLESPLTDFNDRTGEVVTLDSAAVNSIFSSGQNDIGLQVTDNTALAYPGSGEPDLTAASFGKVNVVEGCICDLASRVKRGKVQLTWTDTGAASYDIYRSTVGPNSGFELIAADHVSTYSTYLDGAVVNGTTYYYRVVTSDDCGSDVVEATPVASRR